MESGGRPAGVRKRGTALNPALSGQTPQESGGGGRRETMMNPNIPNDRRPVNNQLIIGDGIPAGTVLLDRYVVEGRMNVESGEADLYVVRLDQREFVAKLYRRKSSIKPEVVEKLLAIRSPGVARIFDIGEYDDHTVEIIPYYRNGTLQGRRFSFHELKEWIIPSLNQGLHDLHETGIIHKDLKPSNIMLNDDGRSVSIIDFGISSVRQNGASFLVTQTGRTPIYSAPETAGDLFLIESDYYSLGITIFELFTGMLPYDGLTDEERMRIIALQKIPCPQDMPDELKQLVWGLTYSDLTNRNNLKNPNRRWTYNEVLRWCKGEKQVTPGDSFSAGAQAHPYWFRGKSYTDLINLLLEFNRYWEEGKKQLSRDNLTRYFLESNIDQTRATYCQEAVEETNRGGNEDLIFFRTMYYVCPEMRNFLWKGHAFADLVDLGKTVLDKMQREDYSMDALLDDLMENGALSLYQRIQDWRMQGSENGKNIESAQFRALEALETAGRANRDNPQVIHVLYAQLGFMLSGSHTLVLDGNAFRNVDEVTECVRQSLEDPDVFDRLYGRLMRPDGDLKPVFEAWLLTQNKRADIQKWRKTEMI
ncbi:MAG: protein kinase [Clostridia bacterium]|nr:protein kinase [Clostridia bacterium]